MAEGLLIEQAQMLTLTAPEMTVLVSRFRTLSRRSILPATTLSVSFDATDIPSVTAPDATPAESLIRQYYSCFNERRLSELSAWFDDDAIVEHMPRRPVQRGGEGYLQFVNAWIAAFPNAVLTIERLVPRGTHTHEVTLLATGTHQGALEMGGWIFRPTGACVALHLREVLEVRESKVVFSTVSFDLQQLIEQLTRVDSSSLLKHLALLRELGTQLQAVQGDAARTREVLDRIGRELDAARHIVRPYYR